MRVRYLWVVLILVLAGVLRAGDMKTWNYIGDGRWEQVSAPTSRPVSDPTLDQVERMLENHQPTVARKLGVEWVQGHMDSPVRDRALLLLAEAFYQEDDRIKSFYYCDELMDTYPDSPY